MPGSTTTPSRKRSRDAERLHVAFHFNHSVGARKVIFEAQWPAYACPDRRFASDLTDVDARLGVDMTRYVFIVRDFHSVFLAGLPAHGQFYSGANSGEESIIARRIFCLFLAQDWGKDQHQRVYINKTQYFEQYVEISSLVSSVNTSQSQNGQSTEVLKVGHHGSAYSSTSAF